MTSPLRISFRVGGIPAPGGSKTAQVIQRDGRPVMVPTGTGKMRPLVSYRDAGGERNREWRAAVALAGRRERRRLGLAELLSAPLRLSVIFYMPRPQAHWVGGRVGGTLRDNAPRHHVHAPDSTKLLRSTEDALTDILWVDDSQVVEQHAWKRYSDDNAPGASIEIVELGAARELELWEQASVQSDGRSS